MSDFYINRLHFECDDFEFISDKALRMSVARALDSVSLNRHHIKVGSRSTSKNSLRSRLALIKIPARAVNRLSDHFGHHVSTFADLYRRADGIFKMSSMCDDVANEHNTQALNDVKLAASTIVTVLGAELSLLESEIAHDVSDLCACCHRPRAYNGNLCMIHRNHAHEHVAADRVFAAVTRKFGTLYDDHDAASRRRFAFEYAQSHVPVPRVPATAKFVRVSNMVADDAMKMICSKKWMSEIVFDGLRAKQNESELEWRARVMKALDITEFDVSLYAVIAAKYEQVGFLKRLYSVLKEQRGVKKDDVLRDQIRDLMNDGMNAADIARQLSKNESFIRRVVRELKAKRQICDLVNDGMTEEAIAKRLGKKEQFISRVVRELKSEHQLLISISGGTKRDLKSEPAPGLDGALERLLRKAEATQQRRKSRGLSKP